MAKVLKWSVPIDDKDHTVTYAGTITNQIECELGSGPNARVTFWTFDSEEGTRLSEERPHVYRIFPTGVEVPKEYKLVATTPRVATLVFHLFEKFSV